MAGRFDILTGAAPATPATGYVSLYPKTDKKLYYKDDAGLETPIGSSNFISPLTTKGDIHTFTTVDARLPVGTNGYVLSANSATATGLEWITAPATYTAENAQDDVGGILTDTATIDFTYNDGAPSITADVIQSGLNINSLGGAPLSIANGGTNNTSAYTAGSVIFSNGTSLTQDNTNLFWDSTLKTFLIGDPGFEGSSINVNGVSYDARMKINDIGTTNTAQLILHRHSTTLTPVIVGALSNSETSAHTAVTLGMPLLQFIGTGWTGTHYDTFAGISLQSAPTGAISATSSPGAIYFLTAPDASNTLTLAVGIDQTQKLTAYVGFTVIGTTTLDTSLTGPLKAASGVVSASAISLTSEVTGVLPLANGGSNKNMTAVNGGIVWTDVDSMEVSAAGTVGQILHSNGAAAPTWSAVNLASEVTGILPIANGGTGSSTQNWVDLTTNQSVAGVKTWSNTTDSTSTTTGGAIFSGGVGIAKRLTTFSISCPGLASNGQNYGPSSSAGGAGSLAIGTGAVTGTPSTFDLFPSIAIGYNASVSVNGFGGGMAIGASSSAANYYCSAIGNSTVAGNGSNTLATAIGYGASATGQGSFALGANSSATGGLAIGYSASASNGGISITGSASAAGAFTVGGTASGTNSIAIGITSNAGHANSIIIGPNKVSTATNQLILGENVNDCYIGKGVTNATPNAITVQPTGASGTNIAGAAHTVAGGKSTGTGVGGDIIFVTSQAGITGSGLNTLTEQGRFETSTKTFKVAAGQSTSFSRVGGCYAKTLTDSSNTSTTETDLHSYTLVASLLGINGDSLEFDFCGTFAANANNKTVKIKYGATTMFDSTALAVNSGSWRVIGRIFRTGAATQRFILTASSDNATFPLKTVYGTAAETLSGTVVLKATGQSGTASSDITNTLSEIKWQPCP